MDSEEDVKSEIEEMKNNYINHYLFTYKIGILQPNDTLENAQKLAITAANELQEYFNKNDFLDCERYSYIVLVEVNSMNDKALAVHGRNHICKTDKYFICHKQDQDFHFVIHVWKIDRNA